MRQQAWLAVAFLAITSLPTLSHAAELTPWDRWFYREIERQESLRKTPRGLQLSARPFELSVLEEQERFGWQRRDITVEGSYSSELPEVTRRRGHWITKGSNASASIEGGWTSEYASLWLEPQLRWSENQVPSDERSERHPTVSSARRVPPESGSFHKAEVHRGNLLLNWRNVLFQAGYDTLRLGSGQFSTLHWDSHTPPMPLIRLGTRTPWKTSWGYWTFSHQAASLGGNPNFPDARISGWRLGYSTDRRFEFGLSRSWVVGMYNDQYNAYLLAWELYDPTRFFKPRQDQEEEDADLAAGGSGNDFRNQQLVTDGRLKFWESGTTVYWEWGREDHEHDLKGISKRWEHTQAKVLGLSQYWGRRNEWSLQLEWADTLQPRSELDWGYNAWYNHQLSWTNEHVILGHPIGADSQMAYVALEHLGKRWNWNLSFTQSEHGVRAHEVTSTLPEIRQDLKLDLRWKQSLQKLDVQLATTVLQLKNTQQRLTSHWGAVGWSQPW